MNEWMYNYLTAIYQSHLFCQSQIIEAEADENSVPVLFVLKNGFSCKGLTPNGSKDF
jgi:hypothetical protein